MRRIVLGWLTALTLAVGILGGAAPANAAAFLAISAANWSYSAAYAASPAGAVYFWGLSKGAGSTSFAAAYSYLGINRAAAFAVARAGFGWRGGWYAQGVADPQSDLGLGIPDISPSLSSIVSAGNGSTVASNLSSAVSSDVSAANGLGSPAYTIDYAGNGEIDGITFNPGGTGTETNAVDELAFIVVSNDNSACTALGDPGCASDPGQTSPDTTSISGLTNELGSSALDTETLVNPGSLLSLGGTWNFGPLAGTNSGSDPILVAQSAPEPASILLLGQGLAGLGLVAAWRRRRRR